MRQSSTLSLFFECTFKLSDVTDGCTEFDPPWPIKALRSFLKTQMSVGICLVNVNFADV